MLEENGTSNRGIRKEEEDGHKERGGKNIKSEREGEKENLLKRGFRGKEA